MKINEDFIKEKVANECVLVPTGGKYQNGIFTLNETAERIYDLICDGKEPDEIVEILCREYDAEHSEAAAFADEFIGKLREIGVVLDE